MEHFNQQQRIHKPFLLSSPSLPLLTTSCFSSSGLQGSLWLFISLGPPLWRLQPRSKTPSRHHFLGQSIIFFLFFFSVHNGGWRILTGQISDFMQKKISDVQRRILNTSSSIVVFRATCCSEKTKKNRRRVSATSQRWQQLKVQIHQIHQSPSCRLRGGAEAEATLHRLQTDGFVTGGGGCGDHAVEIQLTLTPTTTSR